MRRSGSGAAMTRYRSSCPIGRPAPADRARSVDVVGLARGVHVCNALHPRFRRKRADAAFILQSRERFQAAAPYEVTGRPKGLREDNVSHDARCCEPTYVSGVLIRLHRAHPPSRRPGPHGASRSMARLSLPRLQGPLLRSAAASEGCPVGNAADISGKQTTQKEWRTNRPRGALARTGLIDTTPACARSRVLGGHAC